MATKTKATLASLGVKKIDEAAGIVEYQMKNGLKILLLENHAAPVVSFMVVYKVGSRNEAVGYTGSTHFLEHMMFKGTRKFNPAAGSGVMETFSRVGALLNATTWLDRTNYFECVPSEYLELCVQFEADRMRNLNLKQEDRDSEMTVVRNEFERGENSPGSALSKEVTSLAFREHPYHHPTIGWRSDVEGVPLSRMKEFYDTYYWPNNATVIVVGNFKSDHALKLMSKYFGKIPKSPHEIPEVYTVEPPQEGERRVELRRAGDLPQLLIGYHTPCAAHEDNYALSLMHSILGDSGKRSSRLHKALLETGLATSCYASNGEFRDPFLFTCGATLAPGKTFKEVEDAIYAEIELLAREPVAEDEMSRAKSANRKGTILASADPQDFARMLCGAESVDTWKWLVEYDDKYDKVTAEDIMKVAGRYFDKSNRTVGHFIPSESNGKAALSFVPEKSEADNEKEKKKKSPAKKQAKVKVSKNRLEIEKPGYAGSDFEKRVLKEVLPNGLTLLVMPNRGTGSIAINGAIAAGDCFGSLEHSIVPTLTSTMLTRGSENYSKVELAKILE
ncbi:MAG: insulinase family protein, partial [Candidatus Obscuribacterales bacterium]|nr:insulinase family protein [Candidatus Obscuribacterales bacterium]